VHDILRVTWTVAPLHPPLVWRNCPTCRTSMPFACTGDFRTNAQKKRIDIWLIYRCGTCDARWNLPILERTSVVDIGIDLFDAFARSDPALAARHAFDLARLARHGRLDESVDASVTWQIGEVPADAHAVIATIRLALPWRGRADRLIARQLGVSRNRLKTLFNDGVVALEPAISTLSDGQRLHLKAAPGFNPIAIARAIR
jgi:hypothetical protein